MKPILSIKDLHVSYHTYAGEVKAVRGVNLTLNAGEILAIVGESGCGKSVMSKTIMGLIQTPPGEIKAGSIIEYSGNNILDYNEREWQEFRGNECSMIFQDALTSLNPTLTVGWQIAEVFVRHKKMSRKQAFEKAIRLLELVGIPNPEKQIKRYPHEFSGGQRQRIMIAIALALNPKILIADEPTTALDVTIQAQILELMKELQSELGTSIIMITHDLGVVAGFADKIAVMYSGKIVEQGTVDEIFYQPKHPYTKALIGAIPGLKCANKQYLMAIPGMPPNLINLPDGCAFTKRCSSCMKICQYQEPQLKEFSETHQVACWIYHSLAKNRTIDNNCG